MEPPIKPGESISAARLNELQQLATSQTLGPGMYQDRHGVIARPLIQRASNGPQPYRVLWLVGGQALGRAIATTDLTLMDWSRYGVVEPPIMPRSDYESLYVLPRSGAVSTTEIDKLVALGIWPSRIVWVHRFGVSCLVVASHPTPGWRAWSGPDITIGMTPMPPFGVGFIASPSGGPVARRFYSTAIARAAAINGPWRLDNGSALGIYSEASDWTWAAVENTLGGLRTSYGPVPDSWLLWPGLPGFVISDEGPFSNSQNVQYTDSDGSTITQRIQLVRVAPHGVRYRARIATVSQTVIPTVTAQPMFRVSSTDYVYDGTTTYSGVTLPSVSLTIVGANGVSVGDTITYTILDLDPMTNWRSFVMVA